MHILQARWLWGGQKQQRAYLCPAIVHEQHLYQITGCYSRSYSCCCRCAEKSRQRCDHQQPSHFFGRKPAGVLLWNCFTRRHCAVQCRRRSSRNSIQSACAFDSKLLCSMPGDRFGQLYLTILSGCFCVIDIRHSQNH